MSTACEEDERPWETRRLYLLTLVSLTSGTTVFSSLTSKTIKQGTIGYILVFMLIFILIGIPLFYMEFIISQFTARNCIDVWRIRPCLSHIGYIQIIWQCFLLIYYHTVLSFVIHYFLISFEDPLPYYTCGTWSTNNCDIAKRNYTVYGDCLKSKTPLPYCVNLHTTFPEHEYWKYFILGEKGTYYYIAWRVCLASGLACVLIYLSCFKRKATVKWFIYVCTSFPTIGYFLLLIGSMTQKGVVMKFEEAFDTSFSIFVKNYRVLDIFQHVMYMLNVGSGVSFNLGSSTSFHAPCYSNVLIMAVVCATFMVLIVSTVAIMTCPYAYESKSRPSAIMGFMQASFLFEITPRLLKEFDHRTLWLILYFSSNTILGLGTHVIVILSLLETLGSKFPVVNKYNGLFTFGFAILLFLITTPLLGNNGVHVLVDFRRHVTSVNIFIGMIESLVFVVWYGLDKFCEDVHFMQGIRPECFMKLCWVSSSVVLAYVFASEFYYANVNSFSKADIVGRSVLIVIVTLIILITMLRLAVAACKKKFLEAVALDPMWGPRSEVLLRSRAMFSAHAMTKEYMYRQYHLQAGILARQRASNVRRD